MYKKVVAFCSALALSFACVIPLLCSADDETIYYNIISDSRYDEWAPIDDVYTHQNNGHHGGGGGTRLPSDLLYSTLQLLYSAMGGDYGVVTQQKQDDFRTVSDTLDNTNFILNVAAQRVVDMVNNANNGSTSNLLGSFCFTAKRKIVYPSGLWETDYLYYWKYENNSYYNHDFSGVQIGDFLLQPNSFVVFRCFSNGDVLPFYGSTSQFNVVRSFSPSGKQAFIFDKPSGAYSVTVYNANGEADTYTGIRNYSEPDVNFLCAYTDSRTNQYINSITCDQLALMSAADYQNYYKAFDHEPLTNSECLVGNVIFDYIYDNQGHSYKRPAFLASGASSSGVPPYVDVDFHLYDWIVSSGGFFGYPNDVSSTWFSNKFNTDPNNIDPVLPPAYGETNNYITNNHITQNNVSNYYDYGVTYNNNTGQFDLDLNALAAGLAAGIAPQFQGVFDGTFSLQPDIGGSFSGELNNNYISDYNDMIIDIDNKVQEIIDSQSPVWVPPRYPAVNTSAFIPAQVPTIPTNTLPANIGAQMGESLSLGWDLFDHLGLAVIVVPIIVMLLLWRFTGR